MQVQTNQNEPRQAMLRRVSAELARTLEVLIQMGFNARINNNDPHSLVIEGMTDGAARTAMHHLMRDRGLETVTGNIQVPARIRNFDGSRSNHVQCMYCSYQRQVEYDENGRMYVPHTHTLGMHSFGGEPDWCDWSHDRDNHRYRYITVPGRIIVFHPAYLPRLPNQARIRLASRARHNTIVTTMLCLRLHGFPRDISYIIMQQAFGVTMRRRNV